MAKTYKVITISIPKELDKVIDALIKESKHTAKPLTKSKFIAVCIYEYLENSLNILGSQKTPEKEEN